MNNLNFERLSEPRQKVAWGSFVLCVARAAKDPPTSFRSLPTPLPWNGPERKLFKNISIDHLLLKCVAPQDWCVRVEI